MITNLYYYGYYLPNRINNYNRIPRKETKSSPVLKSSALSDLYGSYSKKDVDTSFSLNKSLNMKILKYADSISKNVNGLKNVSNSFLNETNEDFLDYDELEKAISESLEDFTGVFNDFKKFIEGNRENSKKMSKYADDLYTLVDQHGKKLKNLGLKMNDDGMLSFDKNKFQKKSLDDLDSSISSLRDMFKSVYDSTYDVMSFPLSEHMNFKDLNYYYNYNYSPVEANTFKIIETGMIVDIAV